MGMYKTGKSGGSCSHSMGKKPDTTGVKVSASAGKMSGARRDGDKAGAPAMGKGK